MPVLVRGMPCPTCGKETLIEQDGVYVCINPVCGWRKNLSSGSNQISIGCLLLVDCYLLTIWSGGIWFAWSVMGRELGPWPAITTTLFCITLLVQFGPLLYVYIRKWWSQRKTTATG